MRHVETPEIRYIRFNSETLSFDSTELKSDPVVEYLESNRPISRTELVKYWVQSDTYSQAHAYRVVDKSVNSSIVMVGEDGMLYIEKDGK